MATMTVTTMLGAILEENIGGGARQNVDEFLVVALRTRAKTTKSTTPTLQKNAQCRPITLCWFLANVNSSSGSLYAVVRPSVVCRLSVVCDVRAPYSGD